MDKKKLMSRTGHEYIFLVLQQKLLATKIANAVSLTRRSIEVNKKECQYCGGIFPNCSYGRHVSICIENPSVYRRTLEALRLDEESGRIVPQLMYDEVVKGSDDLPSRNTLVRKLGGKWEDVAAHFGLHAKGYTRGPNSSYGGCEPVIDFAEIDAEIETHIKETEELRSAYSGEWPLAARKAYRVIGEWNPKLKCWRPAVQREVFMLK